MEKEAVKHSFSAAEKFILSREFFGMKLGLENIGRFLTSIGTPQSAYETIHLAGTNGKGSAAAMLAAILREAGYKTGLFTSPHLVTLRERIRVNGRIIPKKSVTAFVDRHRQELTRRRLSFFEVVTAMAFDYFERAGVDVAVVETGLGGRLDATNVLYPRLTITTDISLDHVEILGSTIRKIAGEKAGIVKPAVPHLVGLLPPAAEDVLRRRCRHLRAPWHCLSRSEFATHPESGLLDFTANGYRLAKLKPSLQGIHQLRNAALVLKAVTILNQDGLRISRKAALRGIAKTRWPGRFQIVRRAGTPLTILDVCHNDAGVRAFVDSFKTIFPSRKAHVITGFVKRKPHQLMFNSLAEIARQYAIVPLKTRRSVSLDQLIASVDFRHVPYKKFGSLISAYRRLAKTCSSDDIILVLGSHFLVGEFLEKRGQL